MKKVLDFLKQLLDLLPLNGGKTLLGCVIIILATRFSVPNELINPILNYLGLNLDTLGWIVAMLGGLHKVTKAVA